MNELESVRKLKKLTQKEAAEKVGISLRSYIMYEKDEQRHNSLKYRYLLQELERINPLDEDHGILTSDDIKNGCASVLDDYPVDCCLLFGSYAKNRAREDSDVDLLIIGDVNGLRFYELTERLRQSLHKRVDLLDVKQLLNNEALLKEVLKTGIRIYG